MAHFPSSMPEKANTRVLTVEEVVRRDLRRTSFHECGHQQVAWHFGVPSSVELMPNPNGSMESEGFVYGQCTYHCPFPTKRARMLAALAGTVAEFVLGDPSVQAWQIEECLWLQVVGLSPTDRCAAGRISERKIEECLRLVRAAWPDIAQHAQWNAETFVAEYGATTPFDSATGVAL